MLRFMKFNTSKEHSMNTVKRGDRVTSDERQHANVLGTVKHVNTDGSAYVEWHAHGHLSLDLTPADKLTVWRPA